MTRANPLPTAPRPRKTPRSKSPRAKTSRSKLSRAKTPKISSAKGKAHLQGNLPRVQGQNHRFSQGSLRPLAPPTPDPIELLFQHRPGDFASLVAAEEASQNPKANRRSPNAEARVIAKLIEPLVLLAGDDVSRVYGISGPHGRPQILKVG
ncbi:unnamed protein product [Parascedosporium putredinis]|uniref:Uncharacterized protein n=1 Tax=Parascedosporium putredinis TaxID=1442378 RepID=A0A9P1H0Y2_9PEZI|nr:unnamed protein product [Parascedosporium putredinis]CAI7992221.1 unnamed protein product [Parascedosporium putredinis]